MRSSSSSPSSAEQAGLPVGQAGSVQEADLGGVLPGTWLPGERAEVVLDAKAGALASPRAHADSLIVTNHRAVKVGVSQGSRTTTLLPLANISSVEIFDVARSPERLIQGVGLLLVGVMIGGATWLALNFPLLSVVAGGVPILISVYVLAGWAFPDDEGELRLYSSGHMMTQRLGTAAARRDAYGAAYRIYELMAASVARPAPELHTHESYTHDEPSDDAAADDRPAARVRRRALRERRFGKRWGRRAGGARSAASVGRRRMAEERRRRAKAHGRRWRRQRSAPKADADAGRPVTAPEEGVRRQRGLRIGLGNLPRIVNRLR